ncbi:MAG: exopolysaccharide Pel transporter PelG, partial [Tumebacillaceae bacterium]
MAGIGFSLKKALGESRRSSKWRVYVAAAFVAAGPWLLTLTSLFLMLWWGRTFGLVAQGRELFLATVTYAMIGSNLISTTAQFFLTRYLADALYVKAYDRLLSAFVGVFTTTGIVALVLAAVGQSFLPLPFAYK